MTMDEVNERFPSTKYKTWRAERAAAGLPTEGGVNTSPSRAASIRNVEREGEQPAIGDAEEREAPAMTTIEMAQQEHAATATSSNDAQQDASVPMQPLHEHYAGGEKQTPTNPTPLPTEQPPRPSHLSLIHI